MNFIARTHGWQTRLRQARSIMLICWVNRSAGARSMPMLGETGESNGEECQLALMSKHRAPTRACERRRAVPLPAWRSRTQYWTCGSQRSCGGPGHAARQKSRHTGTVSDLPRIFPVEVIMWLDSESDWSTRQAEPRRGPGSCMLQHTSCQSHR